ncbi:MAG TPA: DUF167 domain-containing protein [Acidimicrobiales bacterium]
MLPFEVDDCGDVVLQVLVQPGAARSAVVGRHGDALKVRVAAAPERGRANEALTRLLAAELGVRRSDVAVVAGAAGRRKRVRVRGVGADRLAAWLGGLAG